LKAPVGRPRKEITEEAIAQKQYTYLLPKEPRGRRPRIIEDKPIEIYDNSNNLHLNELTI
jgi:hypothetical protein